MRMQRAVAGVIVALLAASCATQQGQVPPDAGNLTPGSGAPIVPMTTRAPATPAPIADGVPHPSSSASPADAPIDTEALLGTTQALVVPPDPAAAAAYLADAVRDPATARAAAREILLRSGVGVFRADTGGLAAVPVDPAFVDATILEFEVPLLAESVSNGALTTLAPALDLLVALEWVSPAGTLAQLEDSIRAWIAASAADPGAPLAFGGLAVRELMRAAGTDPAGPIRLDPLAFQVVLASLVSDLGHFGGAAAAPTARLASTRAVLPAGDPAAAPGDECDEPAKAYDSGLFDKLYKTIAQKSASIVFGPYWTKAGSRVYDYGKILSTIQARAALAAGMKLTVRSEAGGTPHYRHSSGDGGGSNVWSFTATAEFHTSLAGRIVNCGALAGLRIPANGGIEGLRLQWSISDNIECTERGGNCDQLGRIPSGGGGVTTDASGNSRLQVETIIEAGCPSPRNANTTDKSRCKKGEVVDATSWAKVTVDLTRQPPIKIADLLFYKPQSLPEDTAKALLKVLVDVVTDMVASANAAKGTQAVKHHEVTDYRVAHTVNSIVLKATKCGGPAGPWSIVISGHPGPNTTASGSIDFTLDEEGRGSGSIDMSIVTKVRTGGTTIKASVDVEGTLDVELVSLDDPTSLKFTNMRGKATGAGSGPNISMKKVFSSDDSGASAFPVEAGTFCKG